MIHIMSHMIIPFKNYCHCISQCLFFFSLSLFLNYHKVCAQEILWPKIPNPTCAKGLLHLHQNITVNITFYVGSEWHLLNGLFQVSMTCDIFKDWSMAFVTNHSNSMTFPWPHESAYIITWFSFNSFFFLNWFCILHHHYRYYFLQNSWSQVSSIDFYPELCFWSQLLKGWMPCWCNTLVNVIVCKHHVSLTLVSNKLNTPFFSMLFQWVKKMELLLNVYLKRVQKWLVNFRNVTRKSLTRTNIPAMSSILVLQNHNTVTNVHQICCWSAISLPLVKHVNTLPPPTHTRTQQMLLNQHNHVIHALTSLFGTSYHITC